MLKIGQRKLILKLGQKQIQKEEYTEDKLKYNRKYIKDKLENKKVYSYVLAS